MPRVRLIRGTSAAMSVMQPSQGSMSILDLLAQVTARCPAAPAVEDVVQRLTYAELDARSNAIARRLESKGIGPEKLVGVCTRPSVETIVAIVGVLKTGAAFV